MSSIASPLSLSFLNTHGDPPSTPGLEPEGSSDAEGLSPYQSGSDGCLEDKDSRFRRAESFTSQDSFLLQDTDSNDGLSEFDDVQVPKRKRGRPAKLSPAKEANEARKRGRPPIKKQRQELTKDNKPKYIVKFDEERGEMVAIPKR